MKKLLLLFSLVMFVPETRTSIVVQIFGNVFLHAIKKLTYQNTIRGGTLAATFFKKQDDAPFSQEEKDACYQTMLENEFPTAPFYNQNYNPQQNETVAIQNAINKQFPHSRIKAYFVPNTLYELIYVYLFHEKINGSYWIVSDDIKDFVAHNDDARVKETFWKFNTFLDTFSRDQGKNINLSHQKNIFLLLDKTLATIKQQPEYKDAPNTNPYFGNPPARLYQLLTYFHKKRLFREIVTAELEAHKTNKFLLYRGTQAYTFPEFSSYNYEDFKKYIQKIPNEKITEAVKMQNISMSYGKTLFSGILNDESACALWHMKGIWDKTKTQGYILPINRKNYMTQTTPESLFFIPPLHQLVSVHAGGEYFHTRTKILYNKEDIKTIKRSSIKGINYGHSVPEFYFKKAASQDQLQQEITKFLFFIIQNSIPLFEDTKKDRDKILIKN